MYEALSLDDGGDYVLNDDCASCWVEVSDRSIYISRGRKGSVRVEVYERGYETLDPVGEVVA